jgi:hypothetical protein
MKQHVRLWESFARLKELGMVDEMEAAKQHLVKISQETDWPLMGLDPIGEPNEETGELYFAPESPGFRADGPIDWSLFVVGIEPDGGLNFYYDSAPQEVPGLHSEEDGMGMSSYQEPVPVPFGSVRPRAWQEICDNIQQNNDWS